jgi:hypothetical protein
MNRIKFIQDFNISGDTFVRNGVWDYIDKYEVLLPVSSSNPKERFVFIYRVEANETIYPVDGDYVVEVDAVLNKDYTQEGWNEFITEDKLVEDGDYVKSWIETTGIITPVKSTADQCDYNGEWKNLQKKIEKLYGDNGGFERP